MTRNLGLAGILLAAACADDPATPQRDASGQPLATLVEELAIGGSSDAGADYQFASVLSVVLARDGTVWVLDGDATYGVEQSARLRKFDTAGRFMRQISRVGDGPGEHREPYDIIQLNDGRVALRDYAHPRTIAVYREDGGLDTTWMFDPPLHWIFRGRDPIQQDTAGLIWLPVTGGRPSRDRPPPKFVRVRPDGSILDTLPFPEPPQLENRDLRIVRTLVGGGTSYTSITVPYQASGTWSLTRDGGFGVARTDVYRIERTWPGEPRVLAERRAEPVVIAADELAAVRKRISAEIAEYDTLGLMQVPQLPEVKPLIRSFWFSDDGQLLVLPHTPSVLRDTVWSEPEVLDVFAPDASYRGRLALPDRFRLFGMRGDRIWGTTSDSDDVETVKVYRIRWR